MLKTMTICRLMKPMTMPGRQLPQPKRMTIPKSGRVVVVAVAVDRGDLSLSPPRRARIPRTKIRTSLLMTMPLKRRRSKRNGKNVRRAVNRAGRGPHPLRMRKMTMITTSGSLMTSRRILMTMTKWMSGRAPVVPARRGEVLRPRALNLRRRNVKSLSREWF